MHIKDSDRGFTLIEALVAVAIVSLAIAGPMYTADRAIVAANIAGDQLTASYLAQEGIEYVRTMRDDAYLYEYSQDSKTATQQGWSDFTGESIPYGIKKCGISGNSANAKACTLDPFAPNMGVSNNGNYSLDPCGGNGNSSCASLPLYLNMSNNTYTQNQTGNTKTIFYRTIQASTVPSNPQELTITSTVTWSSHGTYSVTVTDHLTQWQ